ncbi:MAG: DUF1376 domain-containing protein [Caldilineaceae bacterium]
MEAVRMSDARPDPLVSTEVDLRDFAFMPLDVVRLRDSGLTAKASGDEFRAAVLLWCASWHQQPAASLPNDNEELANLCGYGRAMREWSKVRAGALRGWIECSDGRMYHLLVAAKARDAWLSKLAQRARTEAARKAREEARQRQSHSLSQTSKCAVTYVVTESKGQGQGQGIGNSEPSALRSAAPKPRPTKRAPEDFDLDDQMRAWAAKEAPGVDVLHETLRFKDHTFATAKTDWPATWRNWMRSAFERKAPSVNGAETALERSARLRMAEITGGLASRRPPGAAKPLADIIDLGDPNVRALG